MKWLKKWYHKWFGKKLKVTISFDGERVKAAQEIILHETATTPGVYKNDGEWKRRNVLTRLGRQFPTDSTKSLALLLELVLQKKLKA